MKRRAFDNTQARAEGWQLTGSEIQAAGDAGVFACDGHAIAYVRDASDAGSTYHETALRAAGLL